MAGRFSVEAVFKAVDRITAPVSRMQNRIGKFTRAAERNLSSLSRVTSNVGRAMGKGLKVGAVAATAAATAVALALNKVTDAADELAKQSRRLDFPIEEFQEWQFVADQAGVSNELFDKSIGAFSKRMGEARAGTGALVSMLKKSNPELLKQLLVTDDTEEALTLYLKALRETPNAMDRAALASAGFSRAGLKMADIAELSSDAIADLRQEQRENGVITMKQAEAAEAYNDAMASLKRSLMGFVQSVLLPLVPKITEIIRLFREWVVANKDLVSERVLRFFTLISDNMQNIIKWAKRLGIAIAIFVTLITVLKTLVLVMTAVNLVMSANPIGLIIIGVTALIAAVVALVMHWDEVKAAFLNLPGPVQEALKLVAKPITDLIALGKLIVENWGDIKLFFVDVFAVIGKAASKAAELFMWFVNQNVIAVKMVMSAWDPLKSFFKDLWTGVTDIFDAALLRIMPIVEKIQSAIGNVSGAIRSVASFLGLDDEEAAVVQSNVVTPQERAAAANAAAGTTNTSEVTIRDETGRAEVTAGTLGSGLTLRPTGGF